MQDKVIKKINALKKDASIDFLHETFTEVIENSASSKLNRSNSKHLLKKILKVLDLLYNESSS